MTLFYKDTAKAPATFLNEVSQNQSDYNADIISRDFTIYTLWAKQSARKEKLKLYKMIASKPAHVNGFFLDQKSYFGKYFRFWLLINIEVTEQ